MTITATLQETIESLQYPTPDGSVDFPYCYVFDCSNLTDGQTYKRLAVTTDNNSQFMLRRFAGGNLCLNPNPTGKFTLYRSGQNPMSQNGIRPGQLTPGGIISGSWPVLPEEKWEPAGQILFDLEGVLRNFTADTPNIYNSQLGFWGIRRFRTTNSPFVHKTRYAYRELHYTYTFELDVTWAHWTDGVNGIPEYPRIFTVPVFDADFELCSIGVINANGLPVATNDFQLQLYDVSGAHYLASAPMNLPFFNYNATAAYGLPIFPAPSMVWPIKGLIQFAVTSMLPFGTPPQSYIIHFNGIWRQKA